MLKRRLILELLLWLIVSQLLLHNLCLHWWHVDWRLTYYLSWGCRDWHSWSRGSRLVNLSNWLLLWPLLSLLLLILHVSQCFCSLSGLLIVAIVSNNLGRRRSLLFLRLSLERPLLLLTIFIVLNLRLFLLRSLLILLVLLLCCFLDNSGSYCLNHVREGRGLNSALHYFKISFKKLVLDDLYICGIIFIWKVQVLKRNVGSLGTGSHLPTDFRQHCCEILTFSEQILMLSLCALIWADAQVVHYITLEKKELNLLALLLRLALAHLVLCTLPPEVQNLCNTVCKDKAHNCGTNLFLGQKLFC